MSDGPAPGLRVSDPSSHATVARNALSLMAGQVATTALAVVLSAALGRSLGARDFGIFYLITTMSTFAYVFAEWGQPLFVIREAAKDPQRSGDLLGTAVVLRAAFALALTVPVGLVAYLLGYGPRTTRLSVLLVLAALPLFLAQAYGMVFRARDQMGREAAVSVSNKAIVLLLTLPALAHGAGMPGVIAAQAVAGAAAFAMAARLYRPLGTTPLRVSAATARELLVAGMPILAMSAAISAQPYLDAIVLSKLAPAVAVGWFGAAKMILGTLTAPATILATAAYPRLVRASGTPALADEARAALRPLLWLGALAATGTYLFANTAVALIYGPEGFAPAATILQVFAPGFFLLFIDILLGHVAYASGRGTSFAVAKIASVAVGTALNFLLIPIFQARYRNGGMGVVVSFALSELVVFAGAVLGLRRHALQRGMAIDIARAVAAAAATLLLFRVHAPVSPWAGIPLCVAVFAAASLAFGLMSSRDLLLVRALVRRPKRASGFA
jgi:O-antigen/teichoic acid export membrane protein